MVKWLALRAGAPVARGMFSLLVKWLALRAGQSAGLVFSLSWEPVLALVARGMFSLLVKWLALRAGQR